MSSNSSDDSGSSSSGSENEAPSEKPQENIENGETAASDGLLPAALRMSSSSPSSASSKSPSPAAERQSESAERDTTQNLTSQSQDLFGDADDLSSSEDEKPLPTETVEKRGESDNEHDIEEKEGPPPPPPETVINVEAPRISADLGSNPAYFVKLPNFLSIDPKPFDPAHYEEENEDDEIMDEEGRAILKLKCENTIRWRTRVNDDGTETKESNSKFVRWSDGSMSLYLGSEIFDVHIQPMQEHNHLFIRQGAGLQGQAVFGTKLTFRPHSTDTMTHRKMTLNMANQITNKAQKVKMVTLQDTEKDPEKVKAEKIRQEEESLRAKARRESQQRRIRERAAMGGLSAHFLEPDYDSGEEGESLSAIKKSYKPGGREYGRGLAASKGFDSDSDDATKRLEHAKRIESDESSGDEGQKEKKTEKKKLRIEDEDDL